MADFLGLGEGADVKDVNHIEKVILARFHLPFFNQVKFVDTFACPLPMYPFFSLLTFTIKQFLYLV